MTDIKYHRDVLLYLEKLTDILIEKGYFSFYEYSVGYIENLVNYIESYIAFQPNSIAPAYFARYGENLLYITYQSNKQTTWYILFQKMEQHYFVRHITNNHVSEAQYFNIL